MLIRYIKEKAKMISGVPSGGQPMRGIIETRDNDEALGKIYDRGLVNRLTEYLSPVKGHLLIGATGVIIRTAANLVTPFLVGLATNRIVAGNYNGLTIAVLIYLGVLLLMLAAQYFETLNLSIAGQGILFRMRTKMFGHLHTLSMSFFDRNKVGKLMSRVQNDVDQLQTLFTQDFITVAVNLVTLLGIIAIMLVLNWKLALLALSTLPLLIAIIIVWQVFARRAFVQARKSMAVVNDNLQESISGVRVTKSLSREAANVKQFDTINKANLDANKKAAKLQGFIMPVTQMLTDSSYVLVLVFGGFQVLDGKMAVGFLLAFLLYIQRLATPVQQIATIYTSIQQAMASGVRIFELIDVEPEIKDNPGAIDLPTAKGEIQFKKVSFAYAKGDQVLHEIDFKIKTGETVAIAGKTGAGKSSIAGLIDRFYEVNSGEVLIDGYNVAGVTQKSLRKQIAFVPQDPFLFSGSIEDNIRDGRLGANHEEVVEAAQTAGVHNFIIRLEHGYETRVGERGVNLSAGQRQLVCFARAILSKPAILILDEATSSVDTDTEHLMQEALQRVTQGRTCVIIAHRLSTITNADRILVLELGRIVESGTHNELMQKQGLYYNMFKSRATTSN
jgi:ABC-type multidrug transport system fused ATPase/permease subunit